MIEVRNVTKKYGKFYAVRNISFEVADGEIVGFLGKNGAGKSTTMNMITGFIEPTSGSILVNGFNIDTKPNKVKKQIGYMPEGTPLYYELTVKEFINYMAQLRGVPRKERKEAVKKAIEVTGLQTVQNNLTKFLSRGYKQRVSFAGAIVGEPDILILDEPTVGLDPKQVVEIRELIKSFGKTHTIFISSHILSEIGQICDKVIIIDNGEIIAVDTPENLEKETRETFTYSITVDDAEGKLPSIKDSISEINEVISDTVNEDGSKKYTITTKSNKDIRRSISSEISKLGIMMLEIKTVDTSLEDAFIKLVENRKEYSMREMRKIQYDKEIEELREEDRRNREERALKKEAKKEAKARKKAEKEAKKESKSKEGGEK
ncbi:MAG: ABC transporter ATP-binding protein [Clostridia bacterium]|nr:ABC transporter ATP-binding protein [Clostridia bacterium]